MKYLRKMTFGIFIIGLILVICGFYMNGRKELKQVYHNNQGINVPFDVSFSTTSFDNTYENIQSLEIDVSACKLEFRESKGSYIRVEAKEVLAGTKAEVDGSCLEIKGSIWGFNIMNVSHVGTIVIYVPEQFTFNEVEVNMDAGDVQINSLMTNKISIDIDAGNFEANKIICHEIGADVDAGNIEISVLDLQDGEFNCDAGDIKLGLTGNEGDYRFELDSALSNITLNGKKDFSFHHGSKKIEIECDFGSVELKTEG